MEGQEGAGTGLRYLTSISFHCPRNPATELVLWTPPGSQVPHSIRTFMLPPSALAAPPLLLPGRGQGAQPEQMEL